MQRRLSQRHQRGLEEGGKDFPGHGQTAFARGDFTDPLAGEFLEMGPKRPSLLADVANRPDEPLAPAQSRQAAPARAMLHKNQLKGDRWQHPLKISEKRVSIRSLSPQSTAPQINSLTALLLGGIGIFLPVAGRYLIHRQENVHPHSLMDKSLVWSTRVSPLGCIARHSVQPTTLWWT